MQIVTDTATLYSPEEGKELGITVIPACVIINGETYRDFYDIDSTGFLKLIEAGGVPTSSQPSIGDVLAVLEKAQDDILFLSIGDGLSGAYQNAVGARNSLEKNAHIHIIDRKSVV